MALTKWYGILTRAIALAGLLSFFGVSHVHAQDVDETPPVINGLTVTTAPGGAHYFSADISDNVAVNKVFLYYRQEGANEAFLNVAMTQPEDGEKKLFNTSIVMRAGADSVVEYILKANDKAGNESRHGGTFDPTLSSNRFNRPAADGAGNIPLTPGSASVSNDDSPGMSTRKKVLYAVLGIVTVGVLSSLNDTDDPPTPCDESGCRVTIIAPTLQ
ncbi:MAG: hypothetical protein V3U76_20850 [Granulosicoccus sp.]